MITNSQNSLRRILSMVMTVIITIGMLPANVVFAANDGGNITELGTSFNLDVQFSAEGDAQIPDSIEVELRDENGSETLDTAFNEGSGLFSLTVPEDGENFRLYIKGIDKALEGWSLDSEYYYRSFARTSFGSSVNISLKSDVLLPPTDNSFKSTFKSWSKSLGASNIIEDVNVSGVAASLKDTDANSVVSSGTTGDDGIFLLEVPDTGDNFEVSFVLPTGYIFTTAGTSGWKFASGSYTKAFSREALKNEVSVQLVSTKIVAEEVPQLDVTKAVVGGGAAGLKFKFSINDDSGNALKFYKFGAKYINSKAFGSTVFEIQDAQTISFFGLNTATPYTVVETDSKGYAVSYSKYQTVTICTQKFQRTVTITNTNNAEFKIAKTIKNSTDTNKEFALTLYQDGKPVKVKSLDANTYVIDSTGNSTFKIKGGQEITIKGAVPGASYYVEETGAAEYKAEYSNGSITSEKASDAKINILRGDDKDQVINITNTLLDPTLKVSKKVSAPDNGAFTITVSGTFKDNNNDRVFNFGNGQTYSFDAVATVEGVVTGNTYTVKETAMAGHELGNYTTTVTNLANEVLTGDIRSGNITLAAAEDKTVIFTNTRRTDGKLSVEKKVNGLYDNGDTFKFNISLNSTPIYISGKTDVNGNFTLAKDEIIEFTGLISGEKYTIEEIMTGEKYSLTSKAGESVASLTGNKVTFTNGRNLNGKLSVKKEVTGIYNNGDTFGFNISLNGTPIYISGKTDLNGNFTLSNNQVIEFTGLVSEAEYTIEETATGEKYSLVSKIGKSVATTIGNTVTFTNVRKASALSIGKKASGVIGNDEVFVLTVSGTFTKELDSLQSELVTKTFYFTQDGLTRNPVPAGATIGTYNGSTVSVPGVIYGYDYTVTETSVINGYLESYTATATGLNESFTANSGIVTASENKSVVVTNSLSSLKVSKTVVQGNTNGVFGFQVQNDGVAVKLSATPSGSYKYDPSGIITTISIKNSEEVYIYGLPYGEYAVVETRAGGHVAIYTEGTGVYANTVNFSSNNIAASVKITNTLIESKLVIEKKIVNSNNGFGNDQNFTVVIKDGASQYLTFANGVYTGKSATITNDAKILVTTNAKVELTGIPYGTSYTVEEPAEFMPLNFVKVGITQPIFILSSTENSANWLGESVVTNEPTKANTALTIQKDVYSLNNASGTNTYNFMIYNQGNPVPITKTTTGYVYDLFSTNYNIEVTTAVSNFIGIAGAGSVTVTGLPYSPAEYTIQEVNIPAGYSLFRFDGNNFTFAGPDSQTTHTAKAINYIPGNTTTGGGRDGGGTGGNDGRGPDGNPGKGGTANTTTINDGLVPLAGLTTINDGMVPLSQLTTIMDGEIPLSGGVPILEIIGFVGILILLAGVLIGRKKPEAK